MEPQISYNRIIGQGKLDFILGSTLQQKNEFGQVIYGTGQSSDLLLLDITAAASIGASWAFSNIYKYTALFSRVNYNWRDKYIINLTVRRDGSSRFGINKQYANFGAVGAAWIFSEEKLMKDNFSFLSFGKVRGSYGTTGSDQIGDYMFLSRYVKSLGDLPYQGTLGLYPSSIPNPDLEWERTNTTTSRN